MTRAERAVRSGQVAAVLAAALLLAACGDDGNDGGGEAGDASSEESDVEAADGAEAADLPDVEGGYYADREVTIISPYAPGGGASVSARYLAPWFHETLDGNPPVQVENIDGASGVQGSNAFYLTYPDDGSTLLMGAFSAHTPYIFSEDGVEYDLRELRPILGVPGGNVTYVASGIGVESAEDLADATEDLIFAGARPSGGDLIRALAFDLLDIDVTVNWGYDGRGPARTAFQQGESTIDVQTAPAYLEHVTELVDAGDAVPVYTFGLFQGGEIVRDPAFPDLPHVGEVYEMLHGEQPSGPAWDAYQFLVAAGVNANRVLWTHGTAPDEAVEELRDVVGALAENRAFVEGSGEAMGGYDILTGDALDDAIEVMLNPSDEAMAFVDEFIERIQ